MDGIPAMPNLRVVWIDPMKDTLIEDIKNKDAYIHSVSNFWSVMLMELGIEMAPLQTDVKEAIDAVFCSDPDIFKPGVNPKEEGARMLTIKDLSPRQYFVTPQKQFSDLWIADLSPSQKHVREEMGITLSNARGKKNQHHGLMLFEPQGGIVSESSDVLEVATAFRRIKVSGGADTIGQFSATLKSARDVLRDRKSKATRIWILCDVRPLLDPRRSEADQYPALIQDILNDGHSITFIRCYPSLRTQDFLPPQVTVIDL
jgi:hypothetical protein